MDDNTEFQDSINLDETELDTNSTEIDVAKLQESNKRLFERAKKAEAEAKALKANKSPEITNQEQPKTVGVPDEVIDLRLDGYSKDEVEFIIKNGGRKALEDKSSYVSVAINTIREQKRAEEAANAVVDNSQLSEVERKFTPDQLKNMSAAELEKILPKA